MATANITSQQFEVTVILPEEFYAELEQARNEPDAYPGAMMVWIDPHDALAVLEAFSAGGTSTRVPERGWYIMQVAVGEKAVRTFRERYPELKEARVLRLF